MSHQITYRAGEPHTFVATRSFSLGNTGQTVPKGSEVEFDGTMVTYAGLAPVNIPQLRGAVKVGWLELKENYNPHAAPPPPQMAGIKMRKADGGNPYDRKARTEVTAATVEDEEREVGSVSRHAAQTAERNKGNYRREPDPDVRRGSENTAVRPGEAGYQIEEQDGTPVRSLNTPAQADAANISHARSAAAASERAAKIQPGVGQTREEMIQQMNPEERAEYANELAGRAAAYDADAPGQIVAQIEGGPQTIEREGMKVSTEVGGGTAIADLGGTGAKPETEIVVEEGVQFTRTKSPKAKTPPNGETEQARVIARSICPDFPESYVFGNPVKQKIARLQADFADRMDIIKAVAAADTDPEMRTKLIEEFPEAFSG